MKTLDMFVNASFEETNGTITVAARLRGSSNSKSFRLPDAPKGLQLNDGIRVEIDGELSVGDKYVTPESYKIVDIKQGAYQRKAVSMSADDYLDSLSQDAEAQTRAEDENERPY